MRMCADKDDAHEPPTPDPSDTIDAVARPAHSPDLARDAGFELKGTGIRLRLSIAWENMKVAVWGWTFFTVNFVMSTVGMIFNVVVFYVMAEYVGSEAAPLLAEYGGMYAPYIFLGIVFNRFLSASLHGYYEAYSEGYWGGGFEIYHSSPIGVSAYLIGNIAFSYLRAGIEIALYILLGLFVFGIGLAGANILPTLIILGAGVISVTGIGLIAASTFSLLNCKGWSDPVTWLVSLLVGLVSGVYFPPSILPAWVQRIAAFLPQTYAYRSARLTMMTDATLSTPTVAQDLSAILMLAAVYLPVGILLYRKSLRKAETDGALTRWS